MLAGMLDRYITATGVHFRCQLPTLRSKLDVASDVCFHRSERTATGLQGNPAAMLGAPDCPINRDDWEPPARVKAMLQGTGTVWVLGHFGPVFTTGPRSASDGAEFACVRSINGGTLNKEEEELDVKRALVLSCHLQELKKRSRKSPRSLYWRAKWGTFHPIPVRGTTSGQCSSTTS